MVKPKLDLPAAVTWKDEKLYLIDQTRLPGQLIIEKQETIEQVWESIKQLKVRGAPAIGIAGAYGLLVGLKPHITLPKSVFIEKCDDLAGYLDSARPTAVNLSWGLKSMLAVATSAAVDTAEEIFDLMVREAVRIHEEDIACCAMIGGYGAPLIKNKMGVLTHCNAGHLAVSELGTALAPIYMAAAENKEFKVFADETRPLLQGARLTSWELQKAGIDVTLICDNMAAHLMSQGEIQLVIVGTDRVAANGDVANKIGTLGVAILASYFHIPFYVACPFSTIDLDTPTGEQIPIEERDPSEVTRFGHTRIAPEGISVRNPAFDVTPHALIAGFITDKGIIRAPYSKNLRAIFTPDL